MHILGLVLLVIGAFAAYLDKKTYKMILKKEPEGNDALKVKGIGFVIALLGAVLVVTFFK